MNADPFRPLPSEAQYRADMAQLDDDAIIASVRRKLAEDKGEKPSRFNPVRWVVISYALAVCIAVAYAILTWGARL